MDEQIKGGHHDTIKELVLNNEQESIQFFERIKLVFLNIGSWGELFGKGTEFQLTHRNGSEKSGCAIIGDCIKIKIPGPKISVGNGSDWVEIINIEYQEKLEYQKYSMIVSPCQKPGTEPIAHFFESCAKNYFSISRHKETIIAEVHGRNEVPNYDDLSLIDKARNFLVAYKGILGFSKAQWETWAEHILQNKYLKRCKEKI